MPLFSSLSAEACTFLRWFPKSSIRLSALFFGGSFFCQRHVKVLTVFIHQHGRCVILRMINIS